MAEMKTFWDKTHPMYGIYERVATLIPASGPVPSATYSNKKLEKMRKAANAYYDIFNNGGMNRGRSIAKIFGINVNDYRLPWNHTVRWDYIHEEVEPIMARIVYEAYIEQFRKGTLPAIPAITEDGVKDV